jgi:SAM-dependent methyltransferase
MQDDPVVMTSRNHALRLEGAIPQTPREVIGETLSGDILEIGPGSAPFPVVAGSWMITVDKTVPGGRDLNWPELIGTPHGPDSDFDLDLDVDGLAPLADASFDVVIACHVIEHLANPLAALREFHRVLRPTGRLVLVVPDRTRTFDQGRQPTTPDHVLRECREGTQVVSDEHILEFCQAIYRQPPIHPPLVREWHNPKALTPTMYDLHRRRSIHVHCWNPEEFALTLAMGMAAGLATWELVSQYTADDCEIPCNEFGLVLARCETTGPDSADQFLRDWVLAELANPAISPRAASLLRGALLVEQSPPNAVRWADAIIGALMSAMDALTIAAEAKRINTADRLRRAETELATCRNDLGNIRASGSYRLGRQIGWLVRVLRRSGDAGAALFTRNSNTTRWPPSDV